MKRLIALFLMLTHQGHAGQLTQVEQKQVIELINASYQLGPTQKEYLLKSKVLATTKVKNLAGQQQELLYHTAYLHPKSCQQALPKLARYEDYPQYISFIKQVTYDEPKQNLKFILDSMLLPNKMSLELKLPRIDQPGSFPFKLERGIFPNLSGKINVYSIGSSHCLFYTSANWIGKDTGYPASVISLFSENLTIMGFEKMAKIIK
jgi:hypothetical protein